MNCRLSVRSWWDSRSWRSHVKTRFSVSSISPCSLYVQCAAMPVLGQLGLDDGDDLRNVLLEILDALGYPLGQRRVDVRLQRFEAEVLQFGLHPANPEPVG